ncbi:hypothetical protein FJT64_001062 [Amphibalanus amphitrite]|uniref:Ig-like domain-containing protein n=1 Tax=Amphibalanus amphitrite TaxID=1232801 RepID=A0A6A4VP59_AMPAM|nr:hypothetical protein FJT64_001062 [Amphibalanus amphitrite]
MNMRFTQLLLLLTLIPFCWGRKSGRKLDSISCADRNRLIGIAERDRVVTVERLPGSRVSLTCHHCDERDDHSSKRWYFTTDLWAVDVPGKPVELDAGDSARITVGPDHTLVIKELDVNDTGMYYCFDRYHTDGQHKYIYTVDMLFPQRTPPVEGSTERDLDKYKEKYINETTTKKLKTYFRFEDIQLYLSWAPWSTCHGCKGQPGQMWRMGTLRQRNVDFEQDDLKNTRGRTSVSYKTGLAARSMHVFLHEKQLSLVLRELPDYLQRRNCSNPRRCKSKKSAADSLRERSFLAALGPAPRKRFQAAVFEQDPAILECPWPPEKTIRKKLKKMVADTAIGSMLGVRMERPRDRDITWFYYNRVINKSSVFADSGHRMRVSRDGRLMIASVRRDDRGRYSCAEEGVEIAVIQLTIKPTYSLAQSRTSLRVLAIGFIFDLCLFTFFLVVLYRQRRVQRLLAGARWRHEQRQERRRERGRKKRFLLQQRKQLEADRSQLISAGVSADEVLNLLEDTLLKDDGEEADVEEGEEGEEVEEDEDEGEDEDFEDEDDGENIV